MGVISREWPRYKCHKQVWALKIKSLLPQMDGSLIVNPEADGYGPITVLPEYVPKHRPGKPEAGWYIVQYKNGYISFSPAKAFEDGYVREFGRVLKCDFSVALQLLKDGKKVARAGWNGKGMWVVMQKAYPQGIAINKNTAEATGLPEGTVCRFRPYFILFTAQGDFAHWVPSGSDMLADDWMEVE